MLFSMNLFPHKVLYLLFTLFYARVMTAPTLFDHSGDREIIWITEDSEIIELYWYSGKKFVNTNIQKADNCGSTVLTISGMI